MWALVAALNYITLGCDVGNAFAEADSPKVQFFMKVDQPFADWWTQHLKCPPIPLGYVIPILKNLQGCDSLRGEVQNEAKIWPDSEARTV